MNGIRSQRFVYLGRTLFPRFQEFAIHPHRFEDRDPSGDPGAPASLTARTVEILRVFVVQSRFFQRIQIGRRHIGSLATAFTNSEGELLAQDEFERTLSRSVVCCRLTLEEAFLALVDGK